MENTFSDHKGYMKGLQVDSDKEWYHGELTREQAEMTLRDNGSNCMLPHSREQRLSCAISMEKCIIESPPKKHHDM